MGINGSYESDDVLDKQSSREDLSRELLRLFALSDLTVMLIQSLVELDKEKRRLIARLQERVRPGEDSKGV